MKIAAFIDLLASSFLALIFLSLSAFVSILLFLLVFMEGRSGFLLLLSFVSLSFLYVAWLFIKDVIDDVKVIFRRKSK